MRQNILLLSLSLILGLISMISAQTPEAKVKLSLAKGDVISINSGKIVLQTESGTVDVPLTEKTEYLRLSADNPSLKTATAATFADIGTGDKVVVTGIFSDDKKTLPAYKVYLLTKSDIAQKQGKESEQWRTRGISGRVVSVNQAENKINVETGSLLNKTTVVVTAKPNAKFKKYAPDSVEYSKAVASNLTEIKIGDTFRALGDKSTDGAAFTAEEILIGSFQTSAGTIKSIDTTKNEVVISDIQTKKDVTISLASASLVKKFPEEMAQRLAMMQSGGGAAGMVRPGGQGGARPPQAGNPPTGNAPTGNTPAQPGQTGGRPNGGMRGGQGGIDDMLERFPNITINDLKVGDSIAVSSTKNANTDRITAIKLLAGVEPFLKSAQAPTGAQGGGQRGGQSGGFVIPGLDGNIP
jgi:hypothetical protein